jgi:hypothetical protein
MQVNITIVDAMMMDLVWSFLFGGVMDSFISTS